MKKELLLIFLNILPGVLSVMAQPGRTWTLQECIEYALDENIQVRKSDLNNQSFQYYEAQAKAQRFPSVSADITQSFSWSKDPDRCKQRLQWSQWNQLPGKFLCKSIQR